MSQHPLKYAISALSNSDLSGSSLNVSSYTVGRGYDPTETYP